MSEISLPSSLAFVLVLGVSVSSVTVTSVRSGTWSSAGGPRAGGCRIDWILLVFSPSPKADLKQILGASHAHSLLTYFPPKQEKERLVLFYFLKNKSLSW